MDRDRLHDRIRRLLFASPALARAFARGDFRSVFRGRGIEFDSLRDYYPDDDARLIDFRATVRLGRPFVRTFREDRSLTVFLLIDVSPSMEQGAGELSKLDMALLSSSLIAHAAQFRGLPVGCLVFDEAVLGSLAPRRGKSHALAVADSAAAISESRASRTPRARGAPSDLGGALVAAQRMLKRRSLILVLSDFKAAAWERPIGELARRHDVVALRLGDSSDRELPRRGAFDLVDPESGARAWFPLASASFRAAWAGRGEADRARILAACAARRVPVLEIDTADDPARRLLEFFERRRSA